MRTASIDKQKCF